VTEYGIILLCVDSKPHCNKCGVTKNHCLNCATIIVGWLIINTVL